MNEKPSLTVQNPDLGDLGFDRYYRHNESGAEYRVIVRGLAWPGIKPGFGVVLAEDLAEDPDLGAHHIHVMAEAEKEDLDDLLMRCVELKGRFAPHEWYGDPHNTMMWQLLCQFNDEREERNEPKL